MTKNRPENIGICAIEIYFPSSYVAQAELESFYNVPSGKFTIGLGQEQMSICDDNEDINSISLTVVSNLLSKYSICPSTIGRLEVGTETIQDKAKSVKTYLTPLFGENTSLLGVDCLSACYGGTAALLNAVNWIESEDWDGRLALVVAADIAVYETGPARPTGGVGAIAMLIGPNAPILVERGTLACHMEHSFDFYKPMRECEYPIVDGHLSIATYMRALDICYSRYAERVAQKTGQVVRLKDHFDYFVFHAPFTKLVKKAFARLCLNDFLLHPSDSKYNGIDYMQTINQRDPFACRSIEEQFINLSQPEFAAKSEPTLMTVKRLGNLYCASLYAGLLSLIANCEPNDMLNKRIGMFSYGSGTVSTLFALKVVGSTRTIKLITNISGRLDRRTRLSPAVYEKIMLRREKIYLAPNWTPIAMPAALFPGTFYLTHVDDQFRRYYVCKTCTENERNFDIIEHDHHNCCA